MTEKGIKTVCKMKLFKEPSTGEESVNSKVT